MTLQKQFFHLSFAAIMLVFAALPALAQTGTVDNQASVAVTSNSTERDQVAAFRKVRVSIPSKEAPIVAAPATTEKQPSFSLNQFVKSAAEPAMTSDSKVFTSIEKPRFEETSTKSIQFVPSRGPKYPW